MNTTSHLSITLHVTDLESSRLFYTALLGISPVAEHSEYVEYQSDAQNLVVGLLKSKRYPGMSTANFEIQSSDAEFQTVLARLSQLGIPVDCDDRRIGISDPDGNFIGIVSPNAKREVDFDFRNVAKREASKSDSLQLTTPTVWEHRIGQDFVSHIPCPDDSIEQVILQGTYNARVSKDTRLQMVAECFRILKPGGNIVVSGYVGQNAVDSPLNLPGLASRMQVLPTETTPTSELEKIGFENLYYSLFGDIICFQIPGIDLRKICLVGYKPALEDAQCQVTYSGSLKQVQLDCGLVLRFGEPTAIRKSTLAGLLSVDGLKAQLLIAGGAD